jgi:beta-fructofuranosidase
MKRRIFLEAFIASAASAGAQPLLAPLLSRSSNISPTEVWTVPQADTSEGLDRIEFFYRADRSWCGDFIPFCKDDVFHLFYLRDWRDKAAHGEGTPWCQVTTKDFVHFVDRGEMLPRGTELDQDLYVYTGSVIQGEGKYHIFYTGHNPYFPAKGKQQEGVMHAISDDLLHWAKVPEDTFYAPTDKFEPDDWRDPFVFWNEDAGEYWMLVAARLKNGPSRRRGCTGLCVSRDLKTWEVREPFWSPGLYFTHECPDLFRMGDWWYLVFSEFTDMFRTRYRMSRSLKGPWLTPEADYFDARAFYAAKTAQIGDRRFLFGWTPTRTARRDYYKWDWGGNLIVHQLRQENNGSLSVHIPATIDTAWGKPLTAGFPLQFGQVKVEGSQLDIAAPGSFGCAASEIMPDCCKIQAQLRFEAGTRGFGIMLRTSDALEASYSVRFEPQNHRLVFDSWPRITEANQQVSIDGGYMAGLECSVNLAPGNPVDVKIFVDRTIGVIYVNDRIALTVRMYNLPTGRWGFFVDQGSVNFRNVSISKL